MKSSSKNKPLEERLSEAVKKAKTLSKERKFVQSIDLIVNLCDIDLKKPESRIDEVIELPYPTKESKICIIAEGELALEAKKAGAHVIGKEELEAFSGKKTEIKNFAKTFDFFLAEGSLMAKVGKILGPVLGPRRKMPKSISPSVSIMPLIEKLKHSIHITARVQPVIQCKVGREDMPIEQIVENIKAVITTLESKLEKGSKQIKNLGVKLTMGKLVKIKL